MVEHLQNLQFSVLVPLVLEHFLDGYCLASLRDHCLEDNSKGAISNDLFSVVGEALSLLLLLASVLIRLFDH